MTSPIEAVYDAAARALVEHDETRFRLPEPGIKCLCGEPVQMPTDWRPTMYSVEDWAEMDDDERREARNGAPGHEKIAQVGSAHRAHRSRCIVEAVFPLIHAAGVAAGRAQVLAVLRDDALYQEWNRRWGLDPGGPRSYVDAVQRDVMRDFAEWATGGEPRG